MDLLEKGESDFMWERKSGKADRDTPVMYSGCLGFFCQKLQGLQWTYLSFVRNNVILPVVSVEKCAAINKSCNEFKELLTKLLLDEIGDYAKTDKFIGAMKRKKDCWRKQNSPLKNAASRTDIFMFSWIL